MRTMLWTLLFLWAGVASANDYSPLGVVASRSNSYAQLPDLGGYDQLPPIRSAPKATPEVAYAGNKFGKDRVLIVVADWCIHCPKDKLQKALAILEKRGWRQGKGSDCHFQYLDVDKDQPLCDNLLNALDEHVGLPFMVKVENGKVVRRLETGCETPIDQWSLGWLFTGKDERPGREKDKATVRRSGGYPLTGGWWSVEGVWNPTRNFLIRHLTGGGAHRGKFDSNWLASLSFAELQSVHTDDHTGRIKWAWVNKPSPVLTAEKPVPKPVAARPVPAVAASRYCPTGNCPYSSQRNRYVRRR